MNRAASFLWATTVALVLSASAYAENKVVKFPSPVKMTGAGSKAAGSAETVDVPTQIIRNRAANRQAVVRPRAGARIPRNVTKINYKKALKYNPAKAALGVVISGAVGAVGWVMSDGMFVKRTTNETYDPQLNFYFRVFAGQQFRTLDDAKKYLDDNYLNNNIELASYVVHGINSFPVATYTVRNKTYGNLQDYTITKHGTCAGTQTFNGCLTAVDYGFSPLSEADYDGVVNAIDSMDDSQLKGLFDELALVDPSFGMLMPEYLRSASGATAEQLATNPLITNIARLNPDGSVSRLKKTEQTTFDITYPESGTNFNYKVTNVTTITNEAGEKVEEQTETEEGTEEAPELSTSLETANDPLKDWATSLVDVPASATPGISYPLLFTYGGTCSLAPVSLPYFGTYGLDPICKAINDYVKPILGILFAAWTILHIFGVWRETTMHVRPA